MGASGGHYYPSVQTQVLVGTKSGTTRTSWTLTSAYQTEGAAKPTKSFAIGSNPKVNFDILYTTGASETGTSLAFKFEGSPDNVNFYRIPNESVAAGTSTLTDREFVRAGGAGATAYSYSLGLDTFYKFGRISFKENSVSSNVGTVYCEATVLGA